MFLLSSIPFYRDFIQYAELINAYKSSWEYGCPVIALVRRCFSDGRQQSRRAEVIFVMSNVKT